MAEFPADHAAEPLITDRAVESSDEIHMVHLCDSSLGEDKPLSNTSNASQSVQMTSAKCSVTSAQVLDVMLKAKAAGRRAKCTGKRVVKKRSPKAVQGVSSSEVVLQYGAGETFVEVRCGPDKPPVESEVESYNEQDPPRTRKPGFHGDLEEQQHRIVERIVQREMSAVQAALEEQQERIIQRVMQELHDTTVKLRHQHEESLSVLQGIRHDTTAKLRHQHEESLSALQDIGARKGPRPVISVEHELAPLEHDLQDLQDLRKGILRDLQQPSTTNVSDGPQSLTPFGKVSVDVEAEEVKRLIHTSLLQALGCTMVDSNVLRVTNDCGIFTRVHCEKNSILLLPYSPTVLLRENADTAQVSWTVGSSTPVMYFLCGDAGRRLMKEEKPVFVPYWWVEKAPKGMVKTLTEVTVVLGVPNDCEAGCMRGGAVPRLTLTGLINASPLEKDMQLFK
jgi:hypothetical protein